MGFTETGARPRCVCVEGSAMHTICYLNPGELRLVFKLHVKASGTQVICSSAGGAGQGSYLMASFP